MGVGAGQADREPVAAGAVAVGALAVLLLTVVIGIPIFRVAPVVAAVVVFAAAYRSLLQWHALIAAVVLVIFLIPIRRYSLPGNLPFELEPYRLLVAVVASAWLTSLLIDRRVLLRRSGLDAPVFLILASVLASVIVNGDRIRELQIDEAVTKKLLYLASFVVVLYLIVSVVRGFREVNFLAKAIVVGGAVTAFFTIIENRTGYNVFNHLHGTVPLLEIEELPGTKARGGRLRAYGSAQHAIPMGAVFVITLPLAVYLTRVASRRWLLAVLVLFLGAFATVSRTAVLMLFVVFAVFLWLRPVETKRIWPLVLPALVIIHFALPATLGPLKRSFFPEGGLIAEQRGFAGSAGSGRIADIGPVLSEVAGKPLVGQGYGALAPSDEDAPRRILDNQWLGTLGETGALGLFAWLWFFVRFIRRSARQARRDFTERGWLAVAVTASVTSYAVGMLTYDAFAFVQVTFIMFILVAIGAALYFAPSERELAPAVVAPPRRPPATRDTPSDGRSPRYDPA